MDGFWKKVWRAVLMVRFFLVKMYTKQHMHGCPCTCAWSMSPAQYRLWEESGDFSHVARAPCILRVGWWGGSRRTGVHSHVEVGQLWLWVRPKVPWGWWCLPTPAPSPLARSPVPRNINQRGINRWLHEKYIMISQIDPKCLLCKRQQAAQVFPAAAVSHLICVSVPLSLDMGKVIFLWFSFRNLL